VLSASALQLYSMKEARWSWWQTRCDCLDTKTKKDYVLIELSGYNLRNNISHALMFRENYLLIYTHWIFIIILRIGAYQISIKSK